MNETSYLNLLKEAYLERKKKNSLYSMRAFARQLNLSPAFISLLFRGKRHLNPETATEIAQRLNWSEAQQKYFLNLLNYETAETDISRSAALRQIEKLKSSALPFNTMEHDIFAVVSTWYYNAILSLLTLKKIRPTTRFISKKFDLDIIEAEVALERLQRMGLVTAEKGRWSATHNYMQVKSTPSSAIRNYHRELLHKAEIALEQQSFEERDFSNITLTVDPKRLTEVNKRIFEFQKEMSLLLEGDQPTEVYQFSMQLFRLTQTKDKSC